MAHFLKLRFLCGLLLYFVQNKDACQRKVSAKYLHYMKRCTILPTLINLLDYTVHPFCDCHIFENRRFHH